MIFILISHCISLVVKRNTPCSSLGERLQAIHNREKGEAVVIEVVFEAKQPPNPATSHRIGIFFLRTYVFARLLYECNQVQFHHHRIRHHPPVDNKRRVFSKELDDNVITKDGQPQRVSFSYTFSFPCILHIIIPFLRVRKLDVRVYYIQVFRSHMEFLVPRKFGTFIVCYSNFV